MPDERPIDLVVGEEVFTPVAAAALIVTAYVRGNIVATDQLGVLIASVHEALVQLRKTAELAPPLTPAVPVRRSVQPDAVTCLDCGWTGRCSDGT
jgi:predicted transcriptional regulator